MFDDMAKRGFFITFEGGEGCGKSTQIASVATYLEATGRQCVITREPGGTPLAEEIRDLLLSAKRGASILPKTELLLFAAARAQHVEELIRPALESGKCVISDRFVDSSYAYQGGARNLGNDSAVSINNFAIGGCMPDLTILLDLEPEEGLKRAHIRDDGNTDRMGAQKLEFYKTVRAAFLGIAAKNPERFAVVDSSGSQAETTQKVLSAVKERLHV